MNHDPEPQEDKLGDMSWGLRNPSVFKSFLWSGICKWHAINVTLITLKIPTKRED